MTSLPDLETEFRRFPGTVSIWCGPLTGPAWYARAEHVPHYAASTMKVAVMVAAWRAAERGDLDLDAELPVHNEHRSAAAGASAFGNDPLYDNDAEVWQRLGQTASLRWLATRMIVKSSNLATNLVLGALGADTFEQVNAVWRQAGTDMSHTDRGIEDYAAREVGITNEVTAADLCALFGALASGSLASAKGTHEMLEILLAQEVREDFAPGLPAQTRLALKNGWVDGVRHSAAVVYPVDGQPYLLAACTTGELPDEMTRDLLARIAAASRP